MLECLECTPWPGVVERFRAEPCRMWASRLRREACVCWVVLERFGGRPDPKFCCAVGTGPFEFGIFAGCGCNGWIKALLLLFPAALLGRVGSPVFDKARAAAAVRDISAATF